MNHTITPSCLENTSQAIHEDLRLTFDMLERRIALTGRGKTVESHASTLATSSGSSSDCRFSPCLNPSVQAATAKWRQSQGLGFHGLLTPILLILIGFWPFFYLIICSNSITSFSRRVVGLPRFFPLSLF